jgi:hypothetical protein
MEGQRHCLYCSQAHFQVSPIEWLPPLHSQVVFDSQLVAAPLQLWVVDSPIQCSPVFLSQVVFESHLVAAQLQLLVVDSWSVGGFYILSS